VMSSWVELNLSQDSQEVGWSPGKKVWAEWMESEEQPATRQARTSSGRKIACSYPALRILFKWGMKSDEEVPRASTCVA